MTGYYKIENEDFWGVVWGGILYQTPQEVEGKWQELFGDKINAKDCSKGEAEAYRRAGFEIIDLEEIKL